VRHIPTTKDVRTPGVRNREACGIVVQLGRGILVVWICQRVESRAVWQSSQIGALCSIVGRTKTESWCEENLDGEQVSASRTIRTHQGEPVVFLDHIMSLSFL
jgi:hypothetical protein